MDALTAQNLVLPLSAATDHRIAGRKAATLARLAACGFPVPPGVVVSAAVLVGAPARTAPWRVPAGVAAALLDAVRPWGSVPLAVRSSGVDEDSADASYAGLFASVLDVRGGGALLAAVCTCWRSALDDRVTSYGTGDEPRLAVLVQPMVAARAAGVAFTADPVSGERGCVVINAVAGIGERLVSGQATPDRWIVRDGQAQRESGGEPVLDAGQARAVAGLARAVASKLGTPQDIEWALADEPGVPGGTVVLLQARPITALPVEPVPVPVIVPPGYWRREASHAPLPWRPFSRAIAGLRNSVLHRVAVEGGLLFDGVEFREIGGWDYVRVVPLGGRQPPTLPGWLVPVALRLVPRLRRRTRAAVAAVRTDLPGRILLRWTQEWRPDFVARIGTLRARPPGTLTDTELRDQLDELLRLVSDGAEAHFRLHGALAVALGEFAFACRDLLSWDEGRMLALLCGSSTTSTEPARALAEVAALAGPAVRDLLDRGTPVDEVLAADPRFAAAFAAYLGESGCRALSYELAEPSLEERSDLVLRLLRDQVDTGFEPRAPRRLAVALRRQLRTARDRLHPEERRRFDRAWRRALRAYPVREDNEYFTISAPFGLLRRAALECGRRLAARGQLARADDLFFLRPEEVRDRLADGADARPVVQRREGEHAWALAHRGPASYGPDPGPPPPLRGLPAEARLVNEAFLWAFERIFGPDARAGAGGRSLAGIGASPGRYTGPVRVVRSEAEFDRLLPGDVLVCPVTSPVWSVLFPSIGALVTDHGGTLSHPAIIAREYHIPAVVATGVGTATLSDGQVVTVDGTTGIVDLLV